MAFLYVYMYVCMYGGHSVLRSNSKLHDNFSKMQTHARPRIPRIILVYYCVYIQVCTSFNQQLLLQMAHNLIVSVVDKLAHMVKACTDVGSINVNVLVWNSDVIMITSKVSACMCYGPLLLKMLRIWPVQIMFLYKFIQFSNTPQVHSGKVASEGLQELSRQFKGLILAYEEVHVTLYNIRSMLIHLH